MISLYRSLILEDEPDLKGNIIPTKSGIRVPKNIPIYIDNIWELSRPKNYPSRRKSVFASSTIELAKKNGPKNGIVYKIQPIGDLKLCQLKGIENASIHPDCERLKNIFFTIFGDQWLNKPVDEKLPLRKLRHICLSKSQNDLVFEQTEMLKANKIKIQNAVEIWSTCFLANDISTFDGNDIGEIFFESTDGYSLNLS